MATKQQYLEWLQLPQVKAGLDTIAWAEGGTYNKLYGGGTFSGNQHPNRAIKAGGYTSTAAGRYQFLYRTWAGIKSKLGLSDFGPVNQDIAALELINQRGQLNKLITGDFEGMMRGLGCAWAALPYATCRQKRRPLSQTMNYYRSRLSSYGGSQTPSSNPMPAASSPSSAAFIPMVALGAVALYLLVSD